MIAIWMTERGVALSSVSLHKMSDIAQSSALNILRKVRMVLENSMGQLATLMPSNEFRSIMNRRSLETPSRMHPRTEEDEHAKETARSNSSAQQHSTVDNDISPTGCIKDALEFLPEKLHDKARQVWKFLGEGPRSFDELACEFNHAASDLNSILGVLEIDGLVERMSGNRFLRTDLSGSVGRWRENCARSSSQYKDGFEGQNVFGPGERQKPHGKGSLQQRQSSDASGPSTGLEQLRLRAVKFVVRFFNGVSRKYLQLYLAAFSCFLDKLAADDEFVFRQCLSAPPIKYIQLLKYVSPSPVKVMTEV
jgi:hypothetical protein